MHKFIFNLFFIGFFLLFPSCDLKKSDKAGGSYVKPSVNYKGRVRKKVSTDKTETNNRNQSKYYNQIIVMNPKK